MTRVMHVITGVEVGGAETTLLELVNGSRATGIESTVVSLSGRGELAGELERAGATVCSLRPHAFGGPAALVADVRRLIALHRPDVVQTWLYHADLVGGLAARAARVPVVWGVHQDEPEPTMKRSTRLVARACASLSSRLPAAIACCSDRARSGHERFGYDVSRMVVVPNGVDVERFAPAEGAPAWLRAAIGVPAGARLVGMVARRAPIKDHRTFFAASRRFAAGRPDVHIVLAGPGVVPEDAELQAWAEAAGVADRCHFLGARRDVARVLSGLDVAVLSSRREGFGNAVAEALACGVPVVATDTGAAAELIGDAGSVVPPGDAGRLGDAVARWIDAAREDREAAGAGGRRRMAASFRADQMAATYADLWAAVAGRTLAAAGRR